MFLETDFLNHFPTKRTSSRLRAPSALAARRTSRSPGSPAEAVQDAFDKSGARGSEGRFEVRGVVISPGTYADTALPTLDRNSSVVQDSLNMLSVPSAAALCSASERAAQHSGITNVL